MKRFVCSDIIPGCSDVFTGEDDQSVLDQVIAHAAEDHGLVKPPLALVELVVATTHSYSAPKKDRHLRLVGREPSDKSPAEPGRSTSTAHQAGAHQAAAYQVGTDQAGTDQAGTDQAGTDQAGTDQAGAHQAAADEAAAGQAAADRRVGARHAGQSAVISLPTQHTARHRYTGAAPSPQHGIPQTSIHPGYRHECLLYSGAEEFLDGIIPFIRDGLLLGEPILVAIAEPRQHALREALGDDESRVVFADMTELANPARIIPAVRQFAAAHAGRAIRGVGEPVWAGRRAAEISEAQLHESLMDVALAADTPLWVLCPYDVSRLDAATIDEAHRSHSSVVRARTSTASAVFGGAVHAEDTFGSCLPQPDQPVLTVGFHHGNSNEIAADVLQFATERGLPAQRAVKLATVVDEITAAGARHTGQQVSVRLWGDESAVVCEVADHGLLEDVMVGRSDTRSTLPHDRDIRLANELCDLVQVRSNGQGTIVRVHSWL